MSSALQLIFSNYSGSEDDQDENNKSEETTTKQLSNKLLRVDKEKKLEPVIELKSAEDIEKWKEERRKRFPKVPSKNDLDHNDIKEVTSNSRTKVPDRRSKSRGGKRKIGGQPPSSSSSVFQRKLTLFEKLLIQQEKMAETE